MDVGELCPVRCGHISSSIIHYTEIILLGMIKRGTRYGEINLRGKTQTNRLAVLIISWHIAGFFDTKKHESEEWK